MQKIVLKNTQSYILLESTKVGDLEENERKGIYTKKWQPPPGKMRDLERMYQQRYEDTEFLSKLHD